MSLILTREALSNQIADDLATRNLNKGLIEGAVNTLNGDDSTEGSVVKSIKDNAENATFTPTPESGIESVTIEEAVNEVGVDVEALKTSKLAVSAKASIAEVSAGTDNDKYLTSASLKTSVPTLNGIKFPSTQIPSADMNTLDDYEEGTWTPTLYGSASGTGVIATLSVADGKYTKIGNQVTLRFAITCSDVSMILGALSIGGLPFSGIAETNLRGVGAVYTMSGFTLTSGYFATLGQAVNAIIIYQTNGTTGANISALTNSANIRGMLVYNV